MAAATVAVLALTAAAGCSGSSLDDSTAKTDNVITIGLIWPKTEPYKSLGDDMAEGWDLYLALHGGKLGGHTITTVTADEGNDEATARNSARKLLDADKADVLVGTASAVPSVAIAPEVTKRKVPFIGTGGRPSTLADISYVWHTSWLSRETGAAVAPYLAQTVKGPVYAIGPDYQGGKDQMGGFTDAFAKAGGKLANPDGATAWTPFPGTKDYKPFLAKVRSSGAKAVYCFYAGGDAVQFVKDYRDSGLGNIPLYGAGFLTEGDALTAEAGTADGIYTVLNYAPTVPGSANAAFVQDFQAKYSKAPTLYNVTAWDAALLLDQAIAAAGPAPTGASINAAIAKIGQLNSPRGLWRFNANHEPDDQFFLRQVKFDGRARGNVVITTLNPQS
ncbi:ABC transporter substrate-binding protein [Paractinoplanes ferrugineus]|uniref:ABC transporter substrate-binding protein n=1 Tax=Paractinoplanes ferrugineus TaxID=113564 RepID=A0A919MGT9_9ACTN|nr:ABC transporter substrate-binding protein [Actinoplanes ferrugineus]GIE14209.1 ABC transporter substrate-binding protein [Actinoplanes ferrugineus]